MIFETPSIFILKGVTDTNMGIIISYFCLGKISNIIWGSNFTVFHPLCIFAHKILTPPNFGYYIYKLNLLSFFLYRFLIFSCQL